MQDYKSLYVYAAVMICATSVNARTQTHTERFLLEVLVHRCFNCTAPRYLASQLQRVADTALRRHLRSASSPALHVPRSLHKTIGDAFPVAAAKVWNKLPPAITSLSSLHTFKRALETELFRRSYGDAHHRPQQH